MLAERSYSLDFLKILATSGIVFHHFQQVTGAYYEGTVNFWGDWFYWGYLVEFFFILSGYFVYKYVSRVYQGEMSLSDWYLRRAKRLLPMVAISAVAYELILVFYLKTYGSSWMGISVSIWGTVISALGIQEGWGFSNPCVNYPVWYISVLLACYLWFYVLTSLARKLKCNPVYFYFAMILLGIGIQTYSINLPMLNGQLARGYYSFFWGLLLAHYVQNYGITGKSVICSILCIAFFTFVFLRYPEYGQSNLNYILIFLVFPSLVFVFESNFGKSIFRHKLWGTLGKISFDVYLWHNPMLPLMYAIIGYTGWNPNFSKISSMYVFLMVSWLVGAVSYYVVETPLNRFVDRKIAEKRACVQARGLLFTDTDSSST